ncbi:hydrolase [Heyndrickxia acidicola]|uniref:Hydrolase n=1 Tax=Heyndrickxia acidicola TaxID=209389 RepID=A0ABU6MFA7_9BACI|nr:hydrolase [Heyndrickxia acidicola]MED1203103.1 hydrolase [Heyndrickxia acidicola]
MEDEKKVYFIEIASGEISRRSTDSPWNFQIEATDDEITQLREVFQQNYEAEWEGFFRAHVPFIEYHYDRVNDVYDQNMMKAYSMIYNLGNLEAKKHIENMGILSSFTTK